MLIRLKGISMNIVLEVKSRSESREANLDEAACLRSEANFINAGEEYDAVTDIGL